MRPTDRRHGPSGQVANELESVLTAVAIAADEIADAELADSWRLQQELGALERSLTHAAALVRRLGALVREKPVVRLSREELALGGVTAEFAGPTDPTREGEARGTHPRR